MKNFIKLLWLLPLLVLIYMYAAQGVGVFLGSTEHYDLLATLGFSPGLTQALTWVSVIVDVAGVLLLVFRPGRLTFIAVGVWTWVPRVIAAMGGVENEILESLAVTVLAVLAYVAYTKGHYLRLGKQA